MTCLHNVCVWMHAQLLVLVCVTGTAPFAVIVQRMDTDCITIYVTPQSCVYGRHADKNRPTTNTGRHAGRHASTGCVHSSAARLSSLQPTRAHAAMCDEVCGVFLQHISVYRNEAAQAAPSPQIPYSPTALFDWHDLTCAPCSRHACHYHRRHQHLQPCQQPCLLPVAGPVQQLPAGVP
jgi:hypothetical protein